MTGLAEFNAALDELEAGIMTATQEHAETVAPYLRGVLRPQHQRTGAMQASIESEVVPTETSILIRSGPTDIATRILELGRRKTPGRPSYRRPQPWFRDHFETLAGALQRGWVERCARVIEAI